MTGFNRKAFLAILAAVSLAGFAALTVAQNSTPNAGHPSAVSAKPLPKDVYPDSLCRLPLVKREDLDEQGKKTYDYYGGPQTITLAGLQGSGGINLHSPKFAEIKRQLMSYLRYDTDLPHRLVELATLVAAREMDSQYEWTAHEPEALKAGLQPQIIDIVKYRKGVAGLGEKEALIITFGRQLLETRKVSSQTFAHAVKVFGNQDVVNLGGLFSEYASTAYMADAVDMQLRPDQKPLLPMP
jgi:4-carboxymuconolactone decarboxylase